MLWVREHCLKMCTMVEQAGRSRLVVVELELVEVVVGIRVEVVEDKMAFALELRI